MLIRDYIVWITKDIWLASLNLSSVATFLALNSLQVDC